MISNLLQGKPFKFPVHPMLVHFPIGLFLLSFLLDVGRLLFPNESGLSAAAFYTMALGVATAFLAAIPGFVDYADIRRDHPAKGKAATHMILNLAAVVLYGLNLALRYGQALNDDPGWLPFLLSAAGVILLSISGFIGGTLVYSEGIGIGRHRRETRTPRQTIELKTSATDPAGMVSVAKADTVQDGESLRVKLGNEIIAVARDGGEFYAVQEFCTHRFGPLSEGRIANGTIECPWHRSCFDLKTGKALNGPAKTDLKTYRVVVKDGMIWLGQSEI